MLNRALYALEGAWHPGFKACLLRGTARLPAKEGENGLMFAALARRVRALCRQGMHRTALEWAKLTVRLDDTDPAGLLLIMDYLALRARECAPPPPSPRAPLPPISSPSSAMVKGAMVSAVPW